MSERGGGAVGPAARDEDLRPARGPGQVRQRAARHLRRGRRGPRSAFWEAQARRLTWAEPWSQVLEWDVPFAKWFVGGKLNVSVNCVDRHVEAGLGDRVAFHWEGEPGDTRTITYADLLARGVPGRQRPDRARRPHRRQGRHLHADDPRDGGRHAGLRPPRRAAHRRLRRLLLRRAARPHPRLRRPLRHHRRRRLPPRRAERPQAGGRRGVWPSAPTCARCSSCGARARTWRGTTPATSGGTTSCPASPSTTRPRRSTPSTRSTSCTPAARRRSPRASCTRAAAT